MNPFTVIQFSRLLLLKLPRIVRIYVWYIELD